MNEFQNKNFEALISTAAYRCVQKEARQFLAQDTSDIIDNERIKRKILRSVERYQKNKSRYHAIKIAIVACMAGISLLFTACMCIPEVRDSMWKAFVKWYEDHVEIRFEKDPPGDQLSDDSTQENNPHIVPAPPPGSIEIKAIATYLPEGYYAVNGDSSALHNETIYYNRDGEMVFRLLQNIFYEDDNDSIIVDSESDPISKISINGHEAVLIEYTDVPYLYFVVWQDECYRYSLYGTFTSFSELLKIAEGIKPEKTIQ